jgi:hypothetical protein
VVNDPTRNRHRCDSSWWDDIDDDIGADGGLNRGKDKSTADTDLAKFGADGIRFIANPHTDGQPDRDAGVLALPRFWAITHERLQDEITFGGLIRCESDESPSADAQPGQGRPPRHHGAAE